MREELHRCPAARASSDVWSHDDVEEAVCALVHRVQWQQRPLRRAAGSAPAWAPAAVPVCAGRAAVPYAGSDDSGGDVGLDSSPAAVTPYDAFVARHGITLGWSATDHDRFLQVVLREQRVCGGDGVALLPTVELTEAALDAFAGAKDPAEVAQHVALFLQFQELLPQRRPSPTAVPTQPYTPGATAVASVGAPAGAAVACWRRGPTAQERLWEPRSHVRDSAQRRELVRDAVAAWRVEADRADAAALQRVALEAHRLERRRRQQRRQHQEARQEERVAGGASGAAVAPPSEGAAAAPMRPATAVLERRWADSRRTARQRHHRVQELERQRRASSKSALAQRYHHAHLRPVGSDGAELGSPGAGHRRPTRSSLQRTVSPRRRCDGATATASAAHRRAAHDAVVPLGPELRRPGGATAAPLWCGRGYGW